MSAAATPESDSEEGGPLLAQSNIVRGENPGEERDWGDYLNRYLEEVEENFEENRGNIGAEGEHLLVGSDDETPLPGEYQQLLDEQLWDYIDEELEENVEGYGEAWELEIDEIEEDGLLGQLNTALNTKIRNPEEAPDALIEALEVDFDLGAQMEVGSPVIDLEKEEGLNLMLDFVSGIKSGIKRRLADSDLEFAGQGILPLLLDEEEKGIPKGVEGSREWEQDEGMEFVKEHITDYTSVPYYSDYIATIFGPKIFDNMFGGSTQITAGLFDDAPVSEQIGENLPYQLIFEHGLGAVTSDVEFDDEGPVSTAPLYWDDGYSQHALKDNEDAVEDVEDRYGVPEPLIERLDGDEEKGLENMMRFFTEDTSMAWILPPVLEGEDRSAREQLGEISLDSVEVLKAGEEEEWREIETASTPDDLGIMDCKLLALDPEDPKSPKEFYEDREVGYSKVFEYNGDLFRARGTINLSDVEDEKFEEYLSKEINKAHIGGMHQDVRPKPGIGGFEYRVGRQLYEHEPEVIPTKLINAKFPGKVKQALEEKDIDPFDEESIPDLEKEEEWLEIYETVMQDDEVESYIEKAAPDYIEDWKAYREEALTEGPVKMN